MTVTTQILRDYLAKLESELPFGKKEKRVRQVQQL